MSYDQFFSSLSVPRTLKLLSSEVQPHYYSTAWESLPLFPREIWQLLSPYCGYRRIETESGSDQPSIVGTSAMRHPPYAAVAGSSVALQSISLNQYKRSKCSSHWFDALPRANTSGAGTLWQKSIIQAFCHEYLTKTPLCQFGLADLSLGHFLN